eukprot:TRINITY_DN8337_c0_g1_i1.p1 TRINITY_DN8337_c0_g1~~TRINITY_DN8337_c0_g1_i1.p1  ORF type:complete len:785 (+),score=334.16 TRINITY_DN8337_c0_g1_i1:63-2417(+)
MAIAHTVNKVDVFCSAEDQCVRAEYLIHAEVFTSEFTFVRLLPSTVAIVGLEIHGPNGVNAGDAHILLQSMYHTLLCSAKGKYKLRIEVMVGYSNKTVKQGVVIPSVDSSDTFLCVTIPSDDVTVSVSPAIWSKNFNPSSSPEDAAHLDTEVLPEGRNAPDTSVHSYLQARLPPTSSINVKWTANRHAVVATPATPMSDLGAKKEEAPKAPEKKKEMVVTSSQDVMYTIGGGICHISVDQTYHITNGSLSGVRIVVPLGHGSTEVVANKWLHSLDPAKKCKILSIEGGAVRGWDCLFCSSEEAQGASALIKKQQQETGTSDGTVAVTSPAPLGSSSSSSSSGGCLVVVVSFDSAIDSVVNFSITAEMELAHTSCRVALPSFTPLGVNRNKGAIAIQAQSSVEIKVCDQDVKSVTKVDIAELPARLTSSNSVLFGYKYLTSQHRLCIDTVKHDDVDVIIALCESATYRITHTGDQLLYDLIFNLKNTQCQYLKVLLPPKSSVWTASVGGQIVKPATDQTGKTLLPLAKGSDVAFNIKLVFVCPAPKLPKSHGDVSKLNIAFPVIDLPVTHIRAEVFVPESHIYSYFEGGIEEVERFNEAEVLRAVHNTDNYGMSYGVRAKKAKGPSRANRFQQRHTNCAPPPPQMYQQPQMQMQMQMPQQMQQQIQMPQRGRANVLNRQHSISSLRDSCSESDSEESIANQNCINDDFMERMDEDDEGEDDEDEIMADGAMAQGIKPLDVSTASLQTGKKYLFEKLLLPSSTVISINCETCMGKKKKERTLRNDK